MAQERRIATRRAPGRFGGRRRADRALALAERIGAELSAPLPAPSLMATSRAMVRRDLLVVRMLRVCSIVPIVAD